MNSRQRTARERLRLIVADTPQNNAPTHAEPERSLPGLRGVPVLPLRAGRHVAAWLLWHTARVSLIADAPPPADLRRTASHSL
jgi:hypothetical protein